MNRPLRGITSGAPRFARRATRTRRPPRPEPPGERAARRRGRDRRRRRELDPVDRAGLDVDQQHRGRAVGELVLDQLAARRRGREPGRGLAGLDLGDQVRAVGVGDDQIAAQLDRDREVIAADLPRAPRLALDDRVARVDEQLLGGALTGLRPRRPPARDLAAAAAPERGAQPGDRERDHEPEREADGEHGGSVCAPSDRR
ncbi:MAG: hypothetical protein K8W52_04660 [Deltaproteobacteria bacterium]|nr:hypothetical protein [Deltaproteobacteria bacterium]